MDLKKDSQKKITEMAKKTIIKAKPKSLRPMRSMVAVRSLKSNTTVAKFSQTSTVESGTN
jgi:hypothetical protein